MSEQHDLDLAEEEFEESARPARPHRALGWLLTLGGLAGFIAAFTLMYEKLQVITDPHYKPSCTLNAVVNCTDIMMSTQAGVFGFPNPLIGIATFPVVFLLGLLVLARVKLPDWVWMGLQLGLLFGFVFVGWLISQALYSIGALCPYCMVVWAVVIPMFWVVTAETLNNGTLADGESSATRALDRWKWAVAGACVVLVAVLVFAELGDKMF